MGTFHFDVDPTVAVTERTVQFCDRDGYLVDPLSWDWEKAQSLAERESIAPLSGARRHIIAYVRKYYETYGNWPLPARIARDLGIRRRYICRVAPEAYFKTAGLPNPGEHKTWNTRSLYEASQTS